MTWRRASSGPAACCSASSLPGEALALEFSGESSDFLRFNAGQGCGRSALPCRSGVRFSYYRDGRTIGSAFEMSGEDSVDAERAARALDTARREALLLPEDPYQVLPSASERSREVFTGRLPGPADLPGEVLGPAGVIGKAGADFVGIHSQGAVCRGAANSRGARHWFGTETFCTDYSAWLPNGKALKSSYAGQGVGQARVRAQARLRGGPGWRGSPGPRGSSRRAATGSTSRPTR